MKYLLKVLAVSLLIYSCNTPKTAVKKGQSDPIGKVADTIKIVNKDLKYEIIIIDVGFDSWLITQKPIWYYSNSFLRTKNNFYVAEWNNRVNQPFKYDSQLYELSIDYSPHIDYGKEVNYKLYMYFQFFEQKYKQRLLY